MANLTVRINGGAKSLEVQTGTRLIDALSAEGVYLPSACGSTGACGLCRLRVVAGAAEPTAAERARLAEQELRSGVRLACQAVVRSPLEIELPVEYLGAQEYSCAVLSKRPLTRDIVELTLRPDAPAGMAFIAGQYILLQTAPRDGSKPVTRPFSIASSPSIRATIQLNIRLNPAGICTPWVFNELREGDSLRIRGPRGTFFLRNTMNPMVFVSGGSGMAPVRSILRTMRENAIARPAFYFFGAVKKSDLFYLEEMAAMERDLPGFRFVPALSGDESAEGWEGERGLVTGVMERRLPPRLEGYEAYLCGRPEMINACVPILESKGIAKANVFYDLFTPSKAPGGAGGR